MSITNKKIYTIDNISVSPRELLHYACDIDEEFNASSIKQTSVAASILRKNGHVIGYVKESDSESETVDEE